MAPKICKCHGEVMYRTPRQYSCAVKARAHYRVTSRRYRATAKGRARVARNNARRIFVGRAFHGHVESTALAATINTHVRSSVRAFVHRTQEDSVLASE